jgi:hypothetical protein
MAKYSSYCWLFMVFWFNFKTEREMALRNLILLPISFILFQSMALAGVMNEREATQYARSEFQAKVLTVKAIEVVNKKYFKIKLLLKSGRIKTVYIDSSNGKLLKKEPKNKEI